MGLNGPFWRPRKSPNEKDGDPVLLKLDFSSASGLWEFNSNLNLFVLVLEAWIEVGMREMGDSSDVLKRRNMEKAEEFLQLTREESESVSSLRFHPHRVGVDSSFYEHFALRGIRVDRVEPGLVSCSFKVPQRLTDRAGKLASGAVATLVDEVSGALVQVEGLPMHVSVDMSISFLSTANAGDELEITSRVLGQRGSYSGTSVLLKNKSTGELIAEGRHSLFGKHSSKI